MGQLLMEAKLDKLLSEDIASVISREQSAFDNLAGPFSESLVLFGAGNLGRKTLAGLRKVDIEPLAFTDNNPLLWNKPIDGLQVLSPQDAANKFGKSAAFIITIWRAIGGDRQARRQQSLFDLNCNRVVSFGYLFWKYADIFLPHYCLDVPHKAYQHADELRNAFYLWGDDASRNEYLAQLRFRMLLDFDGLPSPVAHKQYFADNLFNLRQDEAFIDIGAFDGDTIQEFLRRQESIFNKIVAFEPDPENYKKLQSYLLTLPISTRERITALHLAAGDKRTKISFEAKGTVQSFVSEAGKLEVDCVPLDEIVGDTLPTFIKMDIEGSEVDALIGARHTIANSLPILAICVYHRPDHLWCIPLFIRSLSDQYRFFLRPHDEECWDLVCYAVPVNRLIA
jgi:FkbM family methyltransferase